MAHLLEDERAVHGTEAPEGFSAAPLQSRVESIGLETSLKSVVSTGGGRPAAAFLGGQAFNVIVTLLAAFGDPATALRDLEGFRSLRLRGS